MSLAVAAEPYTIPNHPSWVRDVGGSVAIAWRDMPGSPLCFFRERGRGYAAVLWERIAVVGCYVSRNSGFDAFERFLGEVGDCVIRCTPRPVWSWETSTPSPRCGVPAGPTRGTRPWETGRRVSISGCSTEVRDLHACGSGGVHCGSHVCIPICCAPCVGLASRGDGDAVGSPIYPDDRLRLPGRDLAQPPE